MHQHALRLAVAWATLVLLLLLPACGEDEAPTAALPAALPSATQMVSVDISEPPAGPPAYAADGTRLGVPVPGGALPNLVVIILDTVRHDAVSGSDARGDRPPPMPFLDSLARRGVRFENAVASAPWTLPSITSMFTGLLPSQHRQCHPEGSWPLPDSVTMYAEVLQKGYGYETAAFINGPWFRDRPDRLLQGFDHVRTSFALQGCEAEVGAWNEERDPSRPFFLLLHTLEPHDPYGQRNHPWPPVKYLPAIFQENLLHEGADPSEVFRQCFLSMEVAVALRRRMSDFVLRDVLQTYKFTGYAANPKPHLASELREAYWGGVRWVDGLLEQAYSQLDSMGLLENTLVVVTSDHGEAFGEHDNLAHGLWLYDEVIRIPLVMIGPPPFAGGKVVASEIGLLDTLPTFLDWAGMAPHTGVSGRSALQTVSGRDWCRPVISEEPLTRANTGRNMEAVRISARTRHWKYIATLDLRTAEVFEEAYDLVLDPDEQSDIGEGTGRLPDRLILDDCMCPALNAIRDRVWRSEATRPSEPGAGDAPPSTAGAPPPTGRPPPCRSEG